MARGMQTRNRKRPSQVIQGSEEQENQIQKVTLALHARHIEILEDFIYYARKRGLKTNKSEVVRSLIEILPSINTEDNNYRSMAEIRDILTHQIRQKG